jgi:hypothetical protein
VPVITIEPASIDLATVTNNETTINLRISNHGLVAARGLQLHLGTHPSWQLTAPSLEIGDLAPLSSVEVPVNFQRTQPAPGAGPCDIDVHVDWWFPCGPENRYFRVPVFVFNASGDCRFVPPRFPPPPPLPPPPPYDPPPYDPPQWDPPPPCTAGCSPELPHVTFPEFELELNGCDPCLLAFAGCAANVAGDLTPIGPFLDAWQIAIDCTEQGHESDCVADLLGLIGPIGKAQTIHDCLCGTAAQCNPPGSLGGFVSQVCHRLDGLIEAGTSLLGDAVWLAGRPSEKTVLAGLLSGFAMAMDAGSEEGQNISPDELAQLQALPRPSQLTAAHVQALAARLNRTWDYWSRGIFSSLQTPPGESTDFIALDRLQSGWGAAKAGLLLNSSEGYTNIYSGVSRALDLLKAEFAPKEGACARVKLQIDQQAVLTRSAFNGTFEMNNYTESDLPNVSLVLDIRDTNGLPANHLFGYRVREVVGFIGATNGGPDLTHGLLAQHSSGRAIWIIVPKTNAAPEGPTTYLIGGTLSYEQNGQLITMPLFPERVVVHPSPILRVTYFLQTDVYADDPFTTTIEPPEPFALGLMVRNAGLGSARNMIIDSAQPQITDNDRNLLVDFQILGTQVGNQPLSPSLTAHLGNIVPGSNAVAIWQMTSSLSGRFVGYEASYRHIDDLGQPNLSLVESVTVQGLNHVVLAQTPGSDDVPDFLVDEQIGNGLLPDTLYLSDGRIEPVTAVTNGVVDSPPMTGDLTVRMTSAPTGGWTYLRIPDPAQGAYRLIRVLRGDGSELLFNTNAWTTHRVVHPLNQAPIQEHFLHLLDYDSGGVYDLVYAAIPADLVAPSSMVAALPATNITTEIAVRWSGEDNSGGSGVAYFDVYASVNGAVFTRWLSNTPLRGAIYLGSNYTRYAFYSVATDAAGNREGTPATPDAQTYVSVTNTTPHLVPLSDVVIYEGSTFEKTMIAIDAESPPQQLTFALLIAPDGAQIDPNTGFIRWVTGEAHGDSTNRFTVRVTDNGQPVMSDETTFWVHVKDVNSPPDLQPIPIHAVSIGDLLSVTNRAGDVDLPTQKLTFNIAAGPINSGARINPTNGIFTWRPTPDFASSTQYFTICVTDDGSPSKSDCEGLTVIVNDFLAIGLGSIVTRTQQQTNVALTVYSSAGVTNICFALEYPEDRLANLSLSIVSPRICSATVAPVSNNLAMICVSTCPGDVLLGTEAVAELRFTTLPNNSAFVPLRLVEIAAVKDDGLPVDRVGGRDGRVIIIGNEPLLEATRGTNATVWLTLYGKPGSSYQITSSSYIPRAKPWPAAWKIGLTGLLDSFPLPDTTRPAQFFEAFEFIADPPILEVEAGGETSGNLVLFGTPGATYAVESTTDLTGATGWTQVTTVTLTNSFTVLEGVMPDNDVLFRAIRQ